MSNNPFESPETVSAPVQAELIDGASPYSVDDLSVIGKSQRWIMLAILLQLAAMYLHFFAGPSAAPITLTVTIASIVLSIYSVVRLAAKIYHSAIVGALHGLAMLFPLIGLIVLVILNRRATRLLRQNGIRVGFMGANSDDLIDLRS